MLPSQAQRLSRVSALEFMKIGKKPPSFPAIFRPALLRAAFLRAVAENGPRMSDVAHEQPAVQSPLARSPSLLANPLPTAP